MALGFERSFLPYDRCIEQYTSALGTPTRCGGTPIANISHCSHSTGCSTPAAALRSFETETVIYKIGATIQTRNFRGDLVNAQAPKLVEIQRLPSMGVSDLHFFEVQNPASQASFDACSNSSSPSCYLNQVKNKK